MVLGFPRNWGLSRQEEELECDHRGALRGSPVAFRQKGKGSEDGCLPLSSPQADETVNLKELEFPREPHSKALWFGGK